MGITWDDIKNLSWNKILKSILAFLIIAIAVTAMVLIKIKGGANMLLPSPGILIALGVVAFGFALLKIWTGKD